MQCQYFSFYLYEVRSYAVFPGKVRGRLFVTSKARFGLALETFLQDRADADIAQALNAFANAAVEIAGEMRRGALGDGVSVEAIARGPDGDVQKPLDLMADNTVTNALRQAGVRACASEETVEPVWFGGQGRLIAAIDPLDGSTNLDCNAAVGSILSLLEWRDSPDALAFRQPGRNQKAAAFALYGPHTDLVFTVGDGAHCATLDPQDGLFRMTGIGLRIPEGRAEFAINASNTRHWPGPVQNYVADCLAGAAGPRGKDFNMRWVATMAADAYRILMRGGVYLYPGDAREGYADGRLHCLYETNPIAFIVEQAGGDATDGRRRILDIEPLSIHQRSPFIFGSGDKVEQVKGYFSEGGYPAGRAPLFNRRGLMRG